MAKCDMHVHSKYSEHPSEWFLQRLGAAESYTDPHDLYRIMKKRGMDFVTVTDHNRIDGAMILKEAHPDEVIVGIESTTYFPEDGCKLHVLIYGLNREQFENIQNLRVNVYKLQEYLVSENLVHAVAHPTYNVNGKLTVVHLEKLMLLFNVFEGINGGRNEMHNDAWMNTVRHLTPEHIEKLSEKYGIAPTGDNPWIKGLIGGSDDHAALFMGQTYTTSTAQTPEEFLDEIRNRRSQPNGRSNNFQAFIFTIYKIAWEFYRSRSGALSKSLIDRIGANLFENRSLNMLERWKLKRIKKEVHVSNIEFQSKLQEMVDILNDPATDDIEERLHLLYDKLADLVDSFFSILFYSFEKDVRNGNLLKIVRNLSSAIPGAFLTLPFFSSIWHLYKGRDMLIELQSRFGCTPYTSGKRILWFTDTLDDLNGVAMTLNKVLEISRKNNYPITVVSSQVKRQDEDHYMNLPQVYSFDLPFYESYHICIPSFLKAIDRIYNYRPDKIILSTPGPVGLIGLAVARMMQVECVGVYHTDFTAQVSAIQEDEGLGGLIEDLCTRFYQTMNEVRVPTRAYIDLLVERGIDRGRMKFFPRGLETELFSPRKHSRTYLQHEYKLNEGFYTLYTGRISRDKDLDVILYAFHVLEKQYPDIYLLMAGEGPHRKEFQAHYNSKRIIWMGRLKREILPDFYSGCDLMLFPSTTDTFGMSVLEAQACGLPAMVSNLGGPKEIIVDGESGFIMRDTFPDTWKTMIERLIEWKKNDPQKLLEMRKASRENAMNKASWERFFESFME